MHFVRFLEEVTARQFSFRDLLTFSEWAGRALIHPDFGISVITLFLPQGTDYAHPDLKT